MRSISWRLLAGRLAGVLLLAAEMIVSAAEADHNLEKTFQVSSGGRLTLDADQGACEINTMESDRVQVRVLREVKGGTKAQADELLANHEVTFQQDGSAVTIVAKTKRSRGSFFLPNRAQLQVRFVISLPRKFDVELKTAGGDVVVAELDGRLKARTSSGTIRMQGATGPIGANDAGGNIIIGIAGGDLAAQTSSGSITVQKVNGRAEFSNAGGDIQVGEAGKGVVARTSSGSIHLKSVQGDVEASNAGGDITADAVGGDLTASTSSGSIKVGQVKGRNVSLKNSGGDIGIEAAEGSVGARTSSGVVRIKLAKGRVEANNSGGDISIGEAGQSVVVETSSGSIRIQSVKGPVDAKNSGGNISVGQAEDGVSARTSSGSISIKSAKGKLSLTDAGGNIEVGGASGAIEARTSSGVIVAVFAAQPTEDCRLEVSGGGITVTAPKSAGFNLEANSSGGRVKSELPVVMTLQGEPRSGVLQGKINSGGPALVLRASSGDIEIKASNAPVSQIKVEDEEK